MKKRENNQRVDVCLADVFREQIECLEKSRSLFTVDNYRNVLHSVGSFIGDRIENFNVGSITGTWLNSYVMYLQGNGILPGSIDNYLRVLRSVYNRTAKTYSIPVGADHPFSGIRIQVPPTLKRSLGGEEILSVIDLNLSGREDLLRARDLFLFLFYARGMCFVDVFNLRNEEVSGGYISYRRSKTSAPLQVKIVDEMQEIMDRYRDPDSSYVFPFLRKNRYNGKDISEKSALRRINRQLGKIGKLLGIKLTTYVARHSWASLLESCGTSIAIISQGMGHSSERVTKIYMRGMPSSVIDNANEEMLNKLIRQKITGEEKKCPPLCKNETSNNYDFIEPLKSKS
ncbi:site-specific integrase [uncultured Parabacteroides sp.]|uniref:tyrosine-type recombinase/integrase n=1 Tax=uncultured Parabacteroides sp. TaxID=512312 RepID=UPI0025EF287C|nr:site-specific integrase [uncultured Parabacteroides sp.]